MVCRARKRDFRRYSGSAVHNRRRLWTDRGWRRGIAASRLGNRFAHCCLGRNGDNFRGCLRTMLTSAVFAFETTLQPAGLLPLLGGCTAAYLVSCIVMKNTIMTEKIARRGIRTPVNFAADPLEQVTVGEIASSPVISLHTDDTIEKVRQWIHSSGKESSHQGFPVLDCRDSLVGVVTRRDILSANRSGHLIADLIRFAPVFVCEDCTARDATTQMVIHDIGRLPVVKRNNPSQVVGMITRSDVLFAYRHRISEETSF